MKRLSLFALLLCLTSCLAPPARSQNPTCPTRPLGDSTNACASTAFVKNSLAGSIPLAFRHLLVGNSSGVAVDGGTGITYTAPNLSLNTVGANLNIAASDSGINFGNGMTINRNQVTGRAEFTAQGGLFQFFGANGGIPHGEPSIANSFIFAGGSPASPLTVDTPVMGCSRAEEITSINTTGGQNACLYIDVEADNDSTGVGPNQAQANGLTCRVTQIGTGEAACYMSIVNISGPGSGASYNIFGESNANSPTTSALNGQFQVNNNTGVDLDFNSFVVGGQAVNGMDFAASGSRATAGLIFRGAWDTIVGVVANGTTNYIVNSPNIDITYGGQVQAASYVSNGVAGVSCTAGTMNIATMAVVNGIVTAC